MITWQEKIRERLQKSANQSYSVWTKSSEGVRFKKSKKRFKSPYYFGFSLPDWHHDIITALNENDEHEAKALSLLHLV